MDVLDRHDDEKDNMNLADGSYIARTSEEKVV